MYVFTINTDHDHSVLPGILFPHTKRDSRQAGMTSNEVIQLSHSLFSDFRLQNLVKLPSIGLRG